MSLQQAMSSLLTLIQQQPSGVMPMHVHVQLQSYLSTASQAAAELERTVAELKRRVETLERTSNRAQ
jgi:hypothetical protein